MGSKYSVMLTAALVLTQLPGAFGDNAPLGVESVHPNLWQGSFAPFHRCPDSEQFVARLLDQMSLEEKIGQMIQADIASITPLNCAAINWVRSSPVAARHPAMTHAARRRRGLTW